MTENLTNGALLIKKEALNQNFKLTFSSKTNKEYFLILHGDKQNIYNQLAKTN